MRTRVIKLTFLLCLVGMLFSGCTKEEKETKTESTTAAVVVEQVEKQEESTEDPHKGQTKSWLSGNWVKKEIANRRPIAIMINNIKQAQPQSGILKADIVYECLAEGGITRLLAFFERYDDLEKIGSVRSARHYYVQIADEYDAIFAHYGQTKYAVSEMQSRHMDTLSGLSYLGETIYYRDSNRRAPHNAYTNTKGLLAGIEKQKFRIEYDENSEKHFQFYKKLKKLSKDKANKITLGYSSYTTPYFEYDEKLKQYRRYQYGAKQIDDQTKQQLTYRNVIVQYIKEWDIDRNGYQTMDLTSSGKGWYLSMGTKIPITWEKIGKDSVTQYFDEQGREIRLNSGKTWICIFPEGRKDKVIFES